MLLYILKSDSPDAAEIGRCHLHARVAEEGPHSAYPASQSVLIASFPGTLHLARKRSASAVLQPISSASWMSVPDGDEAVPPLHLDPVARIVEQSRSADLERIREVTDAHIHRLPRRVRGG